MSADSDQFKLRVGSLLEQIKGWIDSSEWDARFYPKRMRNTEQQIYEVPALFLQRGPTRILLDPVAYDVPGAEGVVDLYLMPTYDDLASLFFENGAWNIHYAFPPDSRETQSVIETSVLPLSKETINQVLNSIDEHAEPSF